MLEKLSREYINNALTYRKEALLGWLLKRRPRPVREAIDHLRRELRAARVSRQAVARLEALRGRKGLKLNLGCGGDIRPGWVNLDLNLEAPPQSHDFFNYDLRYGIPLADGCCALAYSSHFFEHLTNQQGQALMRECLRVLEDGGVMRMALPNYRGFFKAYLAADWDYISNWDYLPLLTGPNGERSWGDAADVGIYQFGEHVCFYDEERAAKILSQVGFKRAAISEFNPEVDLETAERRKYSFYIEAVK
ncbi:MAG TPA: methyltransferase domain-containing protein [Pyrinomonadaceae bacterium]|jgi:SAM-dependent methyltransferase